MPEFVAYVQAGKKAGKTAEQVAKEWSTPAKYTGFAARRRSSASRLDVTLIFEETK